jgi:two-component system, OmpR family, KDP operon response regulator KdpE
MPIEADATPHGEAAPPLLALVVEDEPQVMRFLRTTLSAHGYRLAEATTGRQAIVEAATRSPDLILLDLGLPDIDGVEVTRRLREWSATPLIVISARGQEGDKVQALDAGADDYLTKPFGAGELLARIRVALRNAARAANLPGQPSLRFGDVEVDLAARRVSRAGDEVRLTRTEYNLLATLVKHAAKVVTHEQLLREVWGPGATGQTQYLRVYMGQLRHKLEGDPTRPRHLETEIGVGYRLRVE